MNYKKNELLTIAKRENNKKRSFLLVNPLQGKHLPVSPDKTIALMKNLANMVNDNHTNEKLLVIGFAETATAISIILAKHLTNCPYYIQTTREEIPNTQYLFFSEEHSHATEQKISKTFLDQYISKCDRIIFSEDEVTTGKTIENIISVLRKTYPDYNLKFGITSILNGMPTHKIETFQNNDIPCYYIMKTDTSEYEPLLTSFKQDDTLSIECRNTTHSNVETLKSNQGFNTRCGILLESYLSSCEKFCTEIASLLPINDFKESKILIVGTEEFMFIPLQFGCFIKSKFNLKNISFHATTRSPILPSSSTNYPIKKRYILNSFYGSKRTTYIYNLENYDYVIIITDSDPSFQMDGIKSLSYALSLNNCKKIYNIIWS